MRSCQAAERKETALQEEEKGRRTGGKPQVTLTPVATADGGFLPLVGTCLHREHNDKKMLPVLLRGSLSGIKRQGL